MFEMVSKLRLPLLGFLTFTHLLLVVFITATLSLFFIIASVSILPSLAKGDELVEANSKMATSDSVLAVSAPAAAGVLIQVLTAPIALVVDAAGAALGGFLGSVLELRLVLLGGSLISVAGAFVLLWSPVREVRHLSATAGKD